MSWDPENESLHGFPKVYRGGILIGITHNGLAAYHKDNEVYLAELRHEEIKVPPLGYNPMHSVDLEGYEWTVGDYIINVAIEEGPWRALSTYGKDKVERTDKEADSLTS